MLNAYMSRFWVVGLVAMVAAGPIHAGETIAPFVMGLAQASSSDSEISAFYRENAYEAVWTDPQDDDRARLTALLAAFDGSEMHALPRGEFSREDVIRRLEAVQTEGDRARVEFELSELFLEYAHAVQSGVLDRSALPPGIERSPPRRAADDLLQRLSEEPAAKVMRSLPPASTEYSHLVRARARLTDAISVGGWGPEVPDGRYELGDTGPGVIALRNRLVAMGYLERTAKGTFEPELKLAVEQFQEEHGLVVDGVVGGETLSELNRSAVDRLGQVVVAMERERWLNIDRGERHIWVNLAEFRVRVIDDGRETFSTRAVVGADKNGQRSPEFSDDMEHMIVNPSWHVPRSIAINEYLPQFRANPYSNGHLTIYYKGEAISRGRINWPAVTAGNWPFQLKQPPSNSNALGLVKFMFPNRWNIYLHDTPAKSLFDRNTRAFSHGCIRLHRPFEFAYTLLARQTDDPRGLFESKLATGQETRINLDQHVPVHLVYRTAFTTPRGEVRFVPDIYGRDAAVLAALRSAGVVIGDLPS